MKPLGWTDLATWLRTAPPLPSHSPETGKWRVRAFILRVDRRR